MRCVVKAVVFDAVGTLIRPSRPVADAYRDAGLRYGLDLSRDTIQQRFRQAFARQESIDARQATWTTDTSRERRRWREIVREVFQPVAEPGDADALFESLWSHYASPQSWTVYEDARPVWTELGGRGLVRVVASNLDDRLSSILGGLPPFHQCADVCVSAELGVRKPSPSFFAAVQQRLQLESEQLLMVGDDYAADYEAARACGWQALHLDRQAGCPEGPVIHQLHDLLAVLA